MYSNEYPRPFEVFWDAEQSSYYIFAPDGCVLVGGEAAVVKDSVNGNVRLDGALGTALYGHVTRRKAGDGHAYYEVEFDRSETKSGASYDFKVVNFGKSDNDGEAYDVATGLVNFGGGAALPDDVSLENKTSGDGEAKLQIKDFDEPVDADLPGGTLLDMLGLPVNACADTSVSGSTAPSYAFLAKMTTPGSSASSGLSENSLEYVPKGTQVNMRPLALNGVPLCNMVADGDDTDVEIVVPSLAPVPGSGITIEVQEDSEGYPVILIGNSGGGSGGSSWSGYHTTGSSPDVIMCALRYVDNQLQAKFCDEVWDNGLLVSRNFHSNWTVVTTAVPESVCRCSSDPGGGES